MGMIQTDRGWEADENFVVYEENTVLCYMENFGYRRTYRKYNTGYAIGVFARNLETGWCGPILVSDVSDNAAYKAPFGEGQPDTVTPPNYSVRHYNRTWYITIGYWLQNLTYFTTNYPIYDYDDDPSGAELGLRILALAGQQLYRTDKMWAFLAGMASGLASSSYPGQEV